ncbi:hypothetical protein RclHR1_07710009 [Rhizophagus clarus]|uniref:PAS domain-containing protein n=1 Tax=Rhizophagus clarus TaxID=94130 RepID=A0A2Z6S9M1_9GLOM|nr:hypothetical protein RclHR1_07710009 [Rhizophagus clarus]GES95666.1 PAS domain-containing protein [Rhizophagus clarus]
MVNAQEYIKQNFPKHAQEIVAVSKNLEGDLDLSDYPNLTKVDIGINSQLRSLKLASSNRITWMSLYNTNINNFSFVAELPNIQTICLPRTGDLIGGGPGNAYIAQVVQDVCQKKNQELEKLSQEKDQELGKLSKEKDQELEKLSQEKYQELEKLSQEKDQELEKLSQENQQFRELSKLLFPNRPYNFLELQLEVARLKYQELIPQVRNKKIELEQLITNAKNKTEVSFVAIIDLFLGTQKQIVEQGDNSDIVRGQLTAYQNVLQTKLTQEELQTLLNKQTELCQLENHLANLKLIIKQD